MSWARILLYFNAAAFIGYGLACIASPGLPAGYAGFELASVSGTVEVMAMYGGLQAGFGVLMLMGAMDESRQEGALLALALVVGGLALARMLGVVIHGSSSYNVGVLGYEVPTALLALLALRGNKRPPVHMG